MEDFQLPYPIIFEAVSPPRLYPEFQAALTKIGGLTPDGRPRLLLEWGGEATKIFAGYRVAKFRRNTYMDFLAWLVPGSPTHATPEYRKPFTVPIEDITRWPAHLEEFKLKPLAFCEAMYDEPQCNWYISFWMSPEKACIGWDEVKHMAPAPREGWYFPIMKIGVSPTEQNPMGYREPDGQDLEFAERYMWEAKNDLVVRSANLDQPAEGSDIALMNKWLARAIRHQKEEASAKFKAEAREILEDRLATSKRVSIST